MKHASRIVAEKKFESAAAAVRNFSGDDVAAFEKLDAAFKAASAEVAAAMVSHPTSRELARRQNRIRLENRGLMA